MTLTLALTLALTLTLTLTLTLALTLALALALALTKDFYSEPPSLKELTDDEVAARRRELNVRC